MKNVKISDITLTHSALSFRDKLEIAKLLNGAGVDVVNFGRVNDEKVDLLAIRTLSSIFTNAVFACNTSLSKEETEKIYSSLSGAKNKRLVVSLPVSPVQMEYTYAKKPADMLNLISDSVSYAKSLCEDVEFEALDATRSDFSFLALAIKGAVASGATTVTVCDCSGDMLPFEMKAFVEKLFAEIPELSDVSLSLSCSDKLCSANASLFGGAVSGASEVKVSVLGEKIPSLKAFADTVSVKGEAYGLSVSADFMKLGHICDEIKAIADAKSAGSAFDNRVGLSGSDKVALGAETDLATLKNIVSELGYELSDDDCINVYGEFKRIADKKLVTTRDIDAIVATSALKVPPTYRMKSYVITSGNLIGSTAHVIVEKDSTTLSGVSAGNGPVDATFLAIEQITGHHFELDDFQIRSVTEGREAVGEAVVRLRSSGKLYSGIGVSTDIVGASLRAYLSALNKIVYEENC